MSSMQSSELVLNPDGSVYHLNLLPGEIADTLILVGDPDRVAKVTKFFDKVEIKKQKREFITHTGYFHGKRLSVVATGIGTDNIDIVLNELDALVNIDLQKRAPKEKLTSLSFVRFGTSGALQPEIPIDSFVIGSFGLGLDGVMNYYQRQMTTDEKLMTEKLHAHFGDAILQKIRPYITQGTPELIDFFKNDERCKFGITATACGFYGPQGRVLRGKLAMPTLIDDLVAFQYENLKVTNFEMETSAIYGLSNLLGHRACSLNLIIANRANKTFSTRIYEAMDEMILFALEKLVA